MNAYTTQSQARMRERDIDVNLRMNSYLAGAALATLVWQRECRSEAEDEWLLKQHGLTPHAAASRVLVLRQAIGAAMIRAGKRLVGAPRTSAAAEMPGAGTLGVTTAQP